MGDLVSLICPACGGKLKVSANATSMTCQHCGTEHMVKHEANGVMLEAFARCPQCGRNDKSEKVTAVIASQTHEVSGTEQKTEVTVNAQGQQHVVVRDVPYARKQVSILGQNLALPLEPVFSPIMPNPPRSISIGGAVALGVVGLIVGVVGILFVGSSFLSSSNNSALLPFVIGLLLFGGAALFIGGGVLVGVLGQKKARQTKMEYERRLGDIRVEGERIRKGWLNATKRWNQLYYCSRDDCVFIPGENASAPVAQMKEYLYK